MPLYKPSELRTFLDGLGVFAKKSLSQNFLIDANILQKIVALGNIDKDDLILEIGPGPGALTESLLQTKASILAVEKDPIFAKELLRLQTEHLQLTVFEDDILKFPIENVLEKHLKKGKKAKLIANLPYHLTTPILAKVIPMHSYFSTIIVMVQEEVAKRFVAHPGNADYSSFTVFLNFYSTPVYGFKVSRKCFYPVPKVDSAVVVLNLKEAPNINTEAFFKLTRTAFGQRRKMMRASLSSLYSSKDIMEALEKLGKNPLSRPEELSLNEFLALFELLSSCYLNIHK
ncbi:MAG: 16S rRNA (adenine(1518)-N(6)/adenine(1519)-N(6))-dimethyltransferase RsmA [Chlamydiales bacterium]|nr:16S rRNA (adenine(1518)-N(6)/adenine(1519)-N(6))-dimethyltransferase RsmA [Chlamydiales bacterium]